MPNFVDWKYFLFAQYPAFMLLALFFLVSYLRVRKASAVKSVLWVLLFAAAVACSILFVFFGVHYGYWTLKTLFSLGFASWLGVVLVAAALIAHTVHVMEKKHNQKVMEKERKRAAKDKDDAVAQAREEGDEKARQAREEGRRAARAEAEAVRLSRAAEAAANDAAASELASSARSPIELTLGEADASDAAPPDPSSESPAKPE